MSIGFKSLSVIWTRDGRISVHKSSLSLCRLGLSPFQWYDLERARSQSINCQYTYVDGFESLSVIWTRDGRISVHKLPLSLCRWIFSPFQWYGLERARSLSINCPYPYADWGLSPFQWYELERAGSLSINRPYSYVDWGLSPYLW